MQNPRSLFRFSDAQLKLDPVEKGIQQGSTTHGGSLKIQPTEEAGGDSSSLENIAKGFAAIAVGGASIYGAIQAGERRKEADERYKESEERRKKQDEEAALVKAEKQKQDQDEEFILEARMGYMSPNGWFAQWMEDPSKTNEAIVEEATFRQNLLTNGVKTMWGKNAALGLYNAVYDMPEFQNRIRESAQAFMEEPHVAIGTSVIKATPDAPMKKASFVDQLYARLSLFPPGATSSKPTEILEKSPIRSPVEVLKEFDSRYGLFVPHDPQLQTIRAQLSRVSTDHVNKTLIQGTADSARRLTNNLEIITNAQLRPSPSNNQALLELQGRMEPSEFNILQSMVTDGAGRDDPDTMYRMILRASGLNIEELPTDLALKVEHDLRIISATASDKWGRAHSVAMAERDKATNSRNINAAASSDPEIRKAALAQIVSAWRTDPASGLAYLSTRMQSIVRRGLLSKNSPAMVEAILADAGVAYFVTDSPATSADLMTINDVYMAMFGEPSKLIAGDEDKGFQFRTDSAGKVATWSDLRSELSTKLDSKVAYLLDSNNLSQSAAITRVFNPAYGLRRNLEILKEHLQFDTDKLTNSQEYWSLVTSESLDSSTKDKIHAAMGTSADDAPQILSSIRSLSDEDSLFYSELISIWTHITGIAVQDREGVDNSSLGAPTFQ